MRFVVVGFCLVLGMIVAIAGCSKPEEKAPPKVPVAEKAVPPTALPVESIKETAEKVVEQTREMVEQAVEETVTAVKEQAVEKVSEAVREAVPEQHRQAVDVAEEIGRAYLKQDTGTSTAATGSPAGQTTSGQQEVEKALEDKMKEGVKVPIFR